MGLKEMVEGAVSKIPPLGTSAAAINKAITPKPAAAMPAPAVAPVQPAAQQTRAIADATARGAAAGGMRVKQVDNTIERIPMSKVQ